MAYVMIITLVALASLFLSLKDRKTNFRSMDAQLPFLAIEHDYLVGKNGEITAMYELTLPEIFTLSPDEYNNLHLVLTKALKVLPYRTFVHKQDFFMQDTFKADFSKDHTFHSEASDRFFNERPFLNHQCFLYVTKVADGVKLSTSVYNNLVRPSIAVPDQIEKSHSEFNDRIGQFEKLLQEGEYIKVRRLSADEISGTPESAGIIERYCHLTSESEPQIKDIHFKPDLKIGEQHCQVFTLSDIEDLPATCATQVALDKYSTDKTSYAIGFASPISALLPCNHIFNQYLLIDEPTAIIKELETKKKRLQSLSGYSRENGINHDAVIRYLTESFAEQRTPVYAHYNLLLWSDSPDELKNIRNKASAAISKLSAVPRQDTLGHAQLWWAGIPGNAPAIPFNECFLTFTEQATCFFNLETNYRSSGSHFGLRFGDRITGAPVFVDTDDLPRAMGWAGNSNAFVLSGSGGGKSFLMNHMCRSYYDQGCHIVLVDIGHSYYGLCKMVNGYYFTYTEDNPIKFNPFFISEGDYLDIEKKESIKSLLLSLWKRESESYTRSEYVAISNAITAYYDFLAADTSVFPCFNTFYDFFRDTYLNILRKRDGVQAKDFDGDNFLFVLRPFYKNGEYDYLLNATQNLDLLTHRFIVFELDNIKDNPSLFSTCVLIISDLFISKMRKLKAERKMIVIEEAWKAIAREGMAEYIKYLFKTVRKFNGKAVVVTQEIEDLISSPIIKSAIINNSDIKYLLDQSKYANRFDQVQELLGITDKQKAEILSINKAPEPGRFYKECWICLGPNHSKVYRLETSPEEYYTYTSDAREKELVAQYVAKYGSYPAGIKALVRDLCKN